MSICDRCITVGGRTFNLQTGYDWSAVIQERDDDNINFNWHQYLPYSNFMITYAESSIESKVGNRENQNQANIESETIKAFIFKNAPSSRKINMLDRKRRDVIMFEMLNKSNFLVRIQSKKDESYWTLLDRGGHILKMDDRLQSILDGGNWTSI